MSKKILALVFSMILVLSVSAGFAEEASYPEHFEFTLCSWNDGWLNYAATNPVEDYLEARYNVDINVMIIPNAEFMTKIGTLIAADNMPDVITGRGVETSWVEQDAIGGFPLDMVKEYCPNFYNMVEEFNAISGSNGWEKMMVGDDGLLYGLPRTHTGYTEKGSYGMVWNLDILKSIGFDAAPRTIAECDVVFAAYKAAFPDKYVFGARGDAGGPTQAFQYFFDAFGVSQDKWVFNEATGQIEYTTFIDGFKDGLAKIAEWYALDYIDPEFVTDSNDTYGQKFYNGDTLVFDGNAFYVTQQNNYTKYYDNAKAAGRENPEFEWTPALQREDGSCSQVMTYPLLQGNLFSKELVEDTDRFIRVLQVINDLNSYDDWAPAYTVAYGLEGVDWEFNANGFASMLDYATWNNASYKELNGINHIYGHLIGDSPNNARGAYEYNEAQSALIAKYKDAYEYLYEANIKPISQEAKDAVVGQIDREACYRMITAIVIGEKEVSYYDEFKEYWYNNGGQILTDAYNEANMCFFAE